MAKEHHESLTLRPRCSGLIPQSRPDLRENDFAYIAEILKSRQVAAGPLVNELEVTLAKRLGMRHAIAVSSGTSALHLALLALKIGQGDEVIIPSYACVALLHAVHYTGASPVPCDIDPDTLNPSARDIRPLLSRRTRAIIVTHSFGFPADLQEIMGIGVPVIEDCAQSLGALYRGRAVGSYGQISVFSFYATKVICAGEGGMICTNNGRLALRLRDLSRPDQRTDYKLRYNYKLSDLAAGLALRQVARLDDLLARRKAIAASYRQVLAVFPAVSMQVPLAGTAPIYYRYVVQIPRSRAFIKQAASRGVLCGRTVFRPAHRYLKLSPKKFPGTELAWRTGVSVPLYPALTDAEVEHVATFLREAAL